jgi:putative ATPase
MISGMKEKATLLSGLAPAQPLAARMRPTTLDEVVGQVALVGSGGPLRRLIERGEAPSLLLWGPPGSGKSTLAAVIATSLKAVPTSLSATSDGVAEVRKAVAAAIERREHGEQTLLFIDELHRFSRTQQDALLPHVEAGTIILVGATTEAPPRAISPALLSRMRTFRLAPLSSDDLEALLDRALSDPRGFNGAVQVDADARRQLVGYASGDARRLLTLVEMAALMTVDG